MEYVESYDLFGVETKQIPCILGAGPPTVETEGAVGCFYWDTDNRELYVCVAASGATYTWIPLLGDIETALDGIIAIQNSLIGGDEE